VDEKENAGGGRVGKAGEIRVLAIRASLRGEYLSTECARQAVSAWVGNDWAEWAAVMQDQLDSDTTYCTPTSTNPNVAAFQLNVLTQGSPAAYSGRNMMRPAR